MWYVSLVQSSTLVSVLRALASTWNREPVWTRRSAALNSSARWIANRVRSNSCWWTTTSTPALGPAHSLTSHAGRSSSDPWTTIRLIHIPTRRITTIAATPQQHWLHDKSSFGRCRLPAKTTAIKSGARLSFVLWWNAQSSQRKRNDDKWSLTLCKAIHLINLWWRTPSFTPYESENSI